VLTVWSLKTKETKRQVWLVVIPFRVWEIACSNIGPYPN